MFSGIITAIGTIIEKQGDASGVALTIAAPPDFLNAVTLGASIACSGICLTVTAFTKSSFSVYVSRETFSCTTVETWGIKGEINLERSLKMGDEIGGHLVSGHVDTRVLIRSLEQDGESYRLEISLPKKIAPFIAAKGTVALDGISLTVNQVTSESFFVNIIPHTWQETTLRYRKVNDVLNLEVDMLARYVARIAQFKES